MRDDLIGFFSTHPRLAWTLTGMIVVALIGAALSLFDVWRQHEEAKARAREHEAARRRQALDVAHRLPRPMHEKAAQGFSRNGGPHAA